MPEINKKDGKMYKKYQLSNGLKVIVSPMPSMTSVALGVWIGVGGRHEPAKHSGISHLIEHMLFKGTEKRSAKQLKEAVEGVGGSLNGFTADEVTCYMVKVPANYLGMGFDALSDMVFNAKFDQEDLAKEKFVICEEIKMYRDQPADHVGEILGEIMWPNNSLGRPLTGNISTVQSIKREDVIAFKENNYHPANMAVIAAGKVDPKRLFKYVEELYKGKRRKKPAFKAPKADQKHLRVKFATKKINQAHIALGFHAPAGNIKERYAIEVLNIILGGNMSSRLFEELREKFGLCYDIGSHYKRHSDVGEFIIHAGVDNRKILKSIVAVTDELRKIKDLGVTEDELARAKEFAKGQFLLAMESTTARMLWFGYRLMTDKNIPEVKGLLRKVDSVTADDVKKACGDIFKSSGVNLAVIGNINTNMKNRIRTEISKL